MACRTRFAPSPTGKLHLGSLRTALFNYLLAKRYGGEFILRIEDTDQNRIESDAGEQFERILNDYGLKLDQSPLIGGALAPYVQSKRLKLYKSAAEQLLNTGHAYYCFCSMERLDLLRHKNGGKTITKYDNFCRNLNRHEVSARKANGESSVLRFRLDNCRVTFKDIVYKDYVQDYNEGDFIIMKSDSFPTYHFANVVDDYHMGISHVVRGQEWLFSTPKHIKLYEAFNWKTPKWIHLPLITRDGRRKLSKRNADSYVEFYDKEKGYLPLAVLNYLMRNGSGLKNFETQRLYTLEDMANNFDENLITTSPFMMDTTILDKYGRMAFQKADFNTIILPAIFRHLNCSSAFSQHNFDAKMFQADYVKKVVKFLKRNEERFSKMADLTNGDFRFFFNQPNSADKILAKFPQQLAYEYIEKLLFEYKNNLHNYKMNNLKELSTTTTDSTKMPYKNLTTLIRLALIDSTSGPPISELIDFFEPEEIVQRLQNALKMLQDLKEKPCIQNVSNTQ